MRFLILLLLMGLAGCAASTNSGSLSGSPGLLVADAGLANGEPEVALEATTNLLARNPGNVPALLRQAKANAMLGKIADAEAGYRRALAVNNHLTAAQMGLAGLMMASSPAEAEKLYLAVLAEDPRNTKALNDLGVARDMQGHHIEAQVAYHQALAISPDQASTRQNLGLSLALSGKPAEGVAVLGQLAKEGDTSRKARDDLALALALNGRTDEANQVLREEMSEADATKALAGYRELSNTTTP